MDDHHRAPRSQPSPPEVGADLDLPSVLRAEHFAKLQRQVHAECAPIGLLERIIANDIARRAYQLEFLDEVIGAVQREMISGLIAVDPDGSAGHSIDKILANSTASGRLEVCHRRSLGNSRAFHRAVEALFTLQRRRTNSSGDDLPDFDPRFTDESSCERHLVRRFEAGELSCPRCGQPTGHWLQDRKCWECATCGRQSGIRVGTVMYRSPIPLTCWFAAIRLVLVLPTISATEVSERLRIRRLSTAASMLRRIRTALLDDNGPELLAGLDEIYCGRPESGGRI